MDDGWYYLSPSLYCYQDWDNLTCWLMLLLHKARGVNVELWREKTVWFTSQWVNPSTTIHDGNFRRHWSCYVTIHDGNGFTIVTPVSLDPGMHFGLEVKWLSIFPKSGILLMLSDKGRHGAVDNHFISTICPEYTDWPRHSTKSTQRKTKSSFQVSAV